MTYDRWDIHEDPARRLVRCARQAAAIVSYLVTEQLIVLEPESDARARLEARLIRCLKNDVFTDAWAAERLLGVLVRCDAVEEVFANLGDAQRALEHQT